MTQSAGTSHQTWIGSGHPVSVTLSVWRAIDRPPPTVVFLSTATMSTLRCHAPLGRPNSLVVLGAVLLLCLRVTSADWTSPCSPGEFKGDSAACESCAPGKYSTYGHNCTACTVGYFANSSGSTMCAACALEFGHSYTSSVSSSTCDQCVEGNYRGLNDECYPW